MALELEDLVGHPGDAVLEALPREGVAGSDVPGLLLHLVQLQLLGDVHGLEGPGEVGLVREEEERDVLVDEVLCAGWSPSRPRATLSVLSST